MNMYYKPSGKFSPLAFAYLGLISAIGFPLLALAYAYASWYIPFIYINLLVIVVMALGVGFLSSVFVVRLGKMRNPILAAVMGALSGLIALYFAWAIWLGLVLGANDFVGVGSFGVVTSSVEWWQVFALAKSPGAMMELIGIVNEVGTWGTGDTAVSGIFLTLVWVVEALAFIGVPVFLNYTMASSPFCEEENKWFEEEELPPMTFIQDPRSLVSKLEKGQEDPFGDIVLDTGLRDHSVFTIHYSGKGQSYLSIENKVHKLDEKGKSEWNAKQVVTNIAIGASTVALLLNKAVTPQEEPATYTEDTPVTELAAEQPKENPAGLEEE